MDFGSGDNSLITSLTVLYLVVPGILELRSYKDQSDHKFDNFSYNDFNSYRLELENPYLDSKQEQAKSDQKESLPDLQSSL